MYIIEVLCFVNETYEIVSIRGSITDSAYENININLNYFVQYLYYEICTYYTLSISHQNPSQFEVLLRNKYRLQFINI